MNYLKFTQGWPCLVGIMLQLFGQWLGGMAEEPQRVPAMFVFGDSLVEVGNNNYLNSLAKANYYPYGIDSPRGPSGRFCNGKTIVDMIGINFFSSLHYLSVI